MRKQKRINEVYSSDQLGAKGEPIASLHFDMPKSMKDAAKLADKEGTRPTMNAVVIEPASGKAIVTNTRILSTYDIDCHGRWPDHNTGPFQCFIHPKAISAMAGQTVDISVYDDGDTKITVSEAEGIYAQNEIESNRAFPDYNRVIPDTGTPVKLTGQAVKELRQWLKGKCGKYKQDDHTSVIVKLNFNTGEGRVQVTLCAYGEDNGKYADTDTQALQLETAANLPGDFVYNAALFELACAGDWNGEIELKDPVSVAKFNGDLRTTVLMPSYLR